MSNSIKFEHGTDGKLEFDNSGMGLLGLLSLGAIEETALQSCKGNDFQKQYPTDSYGLENASGHAEQILSQLHSSIDAIGHIAANADVGEVQQSIQDAFWLISDLAKLAEKVSFIKSDIDHALNQQAKK